MCFNSGYELIAHILKLYGSEVPNVKGNSIAPIDDVDGGLAQKVSDRQLIKDVWIMKREVDDYEPAFQDVFDYLLGNH